MEFSEGSSRKLFRDWSINFLGDWMGFFMLWCMHHTKPLQHISFPTYLSASTASPSLAEEPIWRWSVVGNWSSQGIEMEQRFLLLQQWSWGSLKYGSHAFLSEMAKMSTSGCSSLGMLIAACVLLMNSSQGCGKSLLVWESQVYGWGLVKFWSEPWIGLLASHS